MASIPKINTPLPTLDLSFTEAVFDWPQPPFAQRHSMAPLPEGPVPCRIETLQGAAVQGELTTFDARAQCVYFRIAAGGEPLNLAFAKFRRLTLTTPWPLARRAPDVPVERVPAAAQARDYRIELHGGGHLAGRTMGHLRAEGGYFLFEPAEDGSAVQRVFVPDTACASVSFGKSAEEAAAEHWVADPIELLRAIEAQRQSRIVSIGEALLQLGLVTRGVLDLMARQQGNERTKPIGEMLVEAGYLDRADLQTALAHKMGYPIVDLTRFPIDVVAARKLSQKAMLEHRVLPLMQHGKRLIVAVDALERVAGLTGLAALSGLEIVPVLVPRGRLALVLQSLPQRLGIDKWAHQVPVSQPGNLGKR